MGNFARRIQNDAGYTLIEVLVASVVLLVGMVGAVSMIDGANARTISTSAREGATNVQRELVERARSIPYTKLVTGTVAAELQALPGLEDASPDPGYQIRRRGFTYTVVIGVCSQDDDEDQFGVHDASFCPGGAAGTLDRNPDDYKRVTIDLTWSGPRAGGRSHQQTLVNNPGSSVSPGICSISLTGATNNVITSTIANASFSLCLTNNPSTVVWSVDGVVQGNATGSGATWNFLWPIQSLFDGTYLVSARAFDSSARSGPTRSLSVTLNRFLPLPPSGFAAGRNGAAVEMEWLANQERDIVGYRAYRGGTMVASCSLTEETTCRDTNPPAQPLLTYTLVALDRDTSGNLREGAASAPVTVTQLNNPPNPPTGLTASTNAAGSTVLTWQAPVPADPDVGDSVAFYRIYRDGAAIEDRYDRTGLGTDLSYEDSGTGGTEHTYRVTAVDGQLAESTVAGPVTH